MKYETLRIQSDVEKDGAFNVTGIKVGVFGIHRVSLITLSNKRVIGKAFTVTHLPTGLAIGAKFRSQHEALEFAKQLTAKAWASLKWKFGPYKVTKPFPRYYVLARAEFRRVRKALNPVFVEPDWGMAR